MFLVLTGVIPDIVLVSTAATEEDIVKIILSKKVIKVTDSRKLISM